MRVPDDEHREALVTGLSVEERMRILGWCALADFVVDSFQDANIFDAVELPQIHAARGGIRFPQKEAE